VCDQAWRSFLFYTFEKNEASYAWLDTLFVRPKAIHARMTLTAARSTTLELRIVVSAWAQRYYLASGLTGCRKITHHFTHCFQLAVTTHRYYKRGNNSDQWKYVYDPRWAVNVSSMANVFRLLFSERSCSHRMAARAAAAACAVITRNHLVNAPMCPRNSSTFQMYHRRVPVFKSEMTGHIRVWLIIYTSINGCE
jgi:hypothetical protein